MKEFCTGEVTSILDKIPIVSNLARKKFVFMFIVAMIKTRAVQFCEIAQALNDTNRAIIFLKINKIYNFNIRKQ